MNLRILGIFLLGVKEAQSLSGLIYIVKICDSLNFTASMSQVHKHGMGGGVARCPWGAGPIGLPGPWASFSGISDRLTCCYEVNLPRADYRSNGVCKCEAR